MKRWFILLLAALLPLYAFAEDDTAAEAEQSNTIVYFHDGAYVLLPDSIARDKAALAEYCAAYFPGRTYTLDPNVASFNYDTVIDVEYVAQLYGVDSLAMTVRLVRLGIHESVVENTQSESLTVPTQYLTIRGFADKEHHIATVYAPRTGNASLRDAPEGGGKVITQAKTGRVVAVIEYTGGTYTKVLYDGEAGYIRTDCLTFHADANPVGQGVLHLKGEKEGAKSVTIRAADSTSATKVTTLKTGTWVTVHAQEDDWYLVEADGWYGYVLQQYVELNDQ